MNFVAVLWLLYGVQCVCWLPARSTAFVCLLGDWLTFAGPGFRLLHPLPSGRVLHAARFPLVEREGRVFAPIGATWWAAQRTTESEREVALADLAAASASGALVKLASRPLARVAGSAEAAALAAGLRQLAAAAPAERSELAAALVRPGFAAEAFATRAEQFDAATRWLGRLADAAAGSALLLVPAAMLAFGAERTLFFAWPGLAALHVAVLIAYARAQRTLLPEDTAARREALFAAALYPPLLWRARHDLAARAQGSVQPAAVAIAGLPETERDRVLRREFVAARAALAGEGQSAAARAERPPAAGNTESFPTATPPHLGLAAAELTALSQETERAGVSEARLFAPPEPSDLRSLAYCPACRSEYRRAVGSCTGCDVELVAFEPPP